MAKKGGFTDASVRTMACGEHGKVDGSKADPSVAHFFLWVRNDGRYRAYQFRFDLNGQKYKLSLGAVGKVSLAAAHAKAREYNAILQTGGNPAEKPEPITNASTFKDDAIRFHQREKGLWCEAHAIYWLQSMQRHVFERLGHLDTAKITVEQIVSVLTPIWGTKHKTALRIHNQIRAVIDFTMARERARFPSLINPALGAPLWLDKVKSEQTPRKSICWKEAPSLYQTLAARDDQPSKALRFLLLCCTPRAGEVIGAKWSEITFAADLVDGSTYGAVWHVPGDRMKSGKSRDIPLSDAAVALLKSLPRTGSEYIFTGRAGKVVGGTTYGRGRQRIGGTFVAFSGRMQHDAMQTLLRDDLKIGCHVHGLRSSFRTWVSDHAETVRDHDAAEICLDHVIGNQVARAYDRADMMTERRALAERWAKFLGA